MSGVSIDFIIRHVVNEYAEKYNSAYTYSEMHENIVRASIKELNAHNIFGNDLEYIVKTYVEHLLKEKFKNNK